MLEVGLPGKVWGVGWVAGEENTGVTPLGTQGW